MTKYLPKISIVTPSYNQGQYIEQTIQSIINQDYKNIEYIIMDGGSSDETVAIIKKYDQKIVYWESKKDDGQSDAILKGFEKSTGDIICWVNSDDLLLPGCLTAVATYFSEHPDEICLVGGTIIIDDKSMPIYHKKLIPSFTVGSTITYEKLLYHGCTFNQSSSFFRRDIFYQVGGFDTGFTFCFDYDMFLRMSKKKAFSFTNRYCSAFRMHHLSKSNQIQEVCHRENQILWNRNGRNDRPKAVISFWNTYYSLQNKLRKYFKLISNYMLFHAAIESTKPYWKHVKQ